MLGSHCAMSPGARTIPAAMVLPTAAEIPNHMPRTLRRRPRPRAAEPKESRVPLDAEPPGAEDKSEVFGNCRVSGTLRNFAMIMGTGEKARRNWRSLKWPSAMVDPILRVLHGLRLVSDEMESDEHQKRIPVSTLQQMLHRIGFADFLHYTFELGLNNLMVAHRQSRDAPDQ